jgi:hypothetical protein
MLSVKLDPQSDHIKRLQLYFDTEEIIMKPPSKVNHKTLAQSAILLQEGLGVQKLLVRGRGGGGGVMCYRKSAT